MAMRSNLFLTLTLALGGCSGEERSQIGPPQAESPPSILRDLPPQVRSFIERKEQDTLALAKKLKVEPDRLTLEYFPHARKGEYRAASRIYQDLRERGGKVESPKFDHLSLPLWDPLLEVQLALDAYAAGAGRFAAAFGEGVAESIPRGSIYFGGTDPGRALPTAFSKSSTAGDPFITLTQNQLKNFQVSRVNLSRVKT